MTEPTPIIGQEAICPDGLGRVKSVSDFNETSQWLLVETYFCSRDCKGAPHNVELIDPRHWGTNT